jgi:hypothetical protein
LFFNQNNRLSRARQRAFPAEVTFYRNISIFLLKHHVMGTYLDTYQTPRARIWIHDKSAIFKMNGIFQAIVGTHPALVAQMDAVIAWSRKACFNTQQ